MHADDLIAHVAVDLRLRHECRHGVDDDDVDRAAAHESVNDVKRLLARIGLRNQKLVDIDAELLRIDGIERVLGVDECRDTAILLRLSDHVQGDRRLARAFRAINLDDAPARQTADAERDVERQNARRNRLHVHVCRRLAKAHDRSFAKFFLYML